MPIRSTTYWGHFSFLFRPPVNIAIKVLCILSTKGVINNTYEEGDLETEFMVPSRLDKLEECPPPKEHQYNYGGSSY
jgi:hypothetical protein